MAEKFLYLTTTGRKSGQPHQIEIWYVEYQGCYYLCSEKHESADWVRNILSDSAVSFFIAEREQNPPSQAGQATIISDQQTVMALQTLFDAKYRWSSGLFVRICSAGSTGKSRL